MTTVNDKTQEIFKFAQATNFDLANMTKESFQKLVERWSKYKSLTDKLLP